MMRKGEAEVTPPSGRSGRASKRSNHRASGSSKGLNITVVLAVTFALLALGINVVRVLGDKIHQKSPIEKAAMEAARALSDIVVNTPERGFVSLSNYPYGGKETVASDGYSLPVRGINSLIGAARLDMIIAARLDQPLMKELAKQDLKDTLLAKDRLIEVIKEALEPGGSAKGRNGDDINPYARAETIYKQNLDESNAYTPGSLKLSIGSIEGGTVTGVAIPSPASDAHVSESARKGDYYLSYTVVPYGGIDFVFGGIGPRVDIVDHSQWREEIPSLPYQIPTVVRAVVTGVKVAGSEDSDEQIACAQPGSVEESLSGCGALTISFPDGPLSEIRSPEDCFTNKQLKNAKVASMDLLTAQAGDYPVDPESKMAEMKWPLADQEAGQSVSRVWILSLYDWIRQAGSRANVASVVAMQKTKLDFPQPTTVLWQAPFSEESDATSIGPIPNGIVHIFEFEEDGVIRYRSKQGGPYPLYAASEAQLYGEAYSALQESEVGAKQYTFPTDPVPTSLVFRAAYDVYIRDCVRWQGTERGGQHGGEPLAMPLLAMTGTVETAPVVGDKQKGYATVTSGSEVKPAEGVVALKGLGVGKGPGLVGVAGKQEMGFVPLVAPQSDFGEFMTPKAPFVKPMPNGTGWRPSASGGGTAVDIRFRRQIDVSDLNGFTSTGYLGITGPISP